MDGHRELRLAGLSSTPELRIVYAHLTVRPRYCCGLIPHATTAQVSISLRRPYRHYKHPAGLFQLPTEYRFQATSVGRDFVVAGLGREPVHCDCLLGRFVGNGIFMIRPVRMRQAP